MSDTETVSELVLQWEELRRQGQSPAPEELCRERPHLADAVARRIREIESMQRMLGLEPREGSADTIDLHGTVPSATPAIVFPPHARKFPNVPGYEILQELGVGGMGVVYKARQVGLGRLVALKTILGARATGHFVRLFQEEAETLAQLHHPNIVHIYQVGEAEGRPFFSMELIDGGHLAEQQARAPLSPLQAARLFETLACAVHAAHERGIVHCDLKPRNILIAAGGSPKIADFGLARRLNAETSDPVTGGTLLYMAREQVDGLHNLIGPRTDVYALGATLYEILVGQPPFAGDSLSELLRRIREDPPKPPRDLNPQVPRDLDAICLKCLNKQPEQRYASAAELADDLERQRTNQPTIARPLGRGERLAKWSRRKPMQAALACGCLLVTLAGLLVAAVQLRNQHLHKQQVVRVAALAKAVLRQNCFECHNTNDRKGDIDILDHQVLLDPRRQIVVVRAPLDSLLIQHVLEGYMPDYRHEIRLPRLSVKEIGVLTQWVADGAMPFPAGPEDTVESENHPLALAVKEIFVERCFECHKYEVAKGGIKILHHYWLVSARRVVIPGDPELSKLYRRIASPSAADVMPPPPHERLSAAEIETIRAWILAGAPAFPRGENSDTLAQPL